MAGKRRRHPRWPRVIFVAVIAALVVAMAAITAKFGVIHIDPTEDTFAVTLKNDTEVPVSLKQCDVKCNEFHEQHRLTPGGTVGVNTSASDTANWWVVQDGSGQVLGCLDLQYNHKEVGLVVNVSATVACPG